MKNFSRNLSNFVRRTEHPYTDRIYKILHNRDGDEYNMNYIIDELIEHLTDNTCYSLKIDFTFSDCDTMISTVVNRVSIDTFRDVLTRMIKFDIENFTAINIDFYKCPEKETNNFVEEKYLGSFMFIVV